MVGDRDVTVLGCADVIPPALREGYVEELTITTGPVILERGKVSDSIDADASTGTLVKRVTAVAGFLKKEVAWLDDRHR